MIFASNAEKKVIIDNAETKPEIVDLATFLEKMGAKIRGVGTGTIEIEGKKAYHSETLIEHSVIPDYTEACTYMIAAAITGGSVCVKNVIANHLRNVIFKLNEMGITCTCKKGKIYVQGVEEVRPTNIISSKPFPSIPSDIHPLFVPLLSISQGKCIVKDLVFEGRYTYVSDLKKMGANIEVIGASLVIHGPCKFRGCEVTAKDIRGGVALLLAGLAAEGRTVLRNIFHIDRGYECIEHNLTVLGAEIKRICP